MTTPNIPDTVLGIDLYHGDDVSSFHAVADGGVRVCILKLGEGMAVDLAFAGRFPRANSVGLKMGTYLFVRPDVAAATQVAIFGDHQPDGVRLFLDLEPSLRDPNDSNSDRWLDIPISERQALLSHLVSAYKVQTACTLHPGLYVTKSFWEDVLGAPDGYQACPWWGPRYDGGTEPPERPRGLGEWVGWQCSENSTVSGCSTPDSIDLSIWKKAFWGL